MELGGVKMNKMYKMLDGTVSKPVSRNGDCSWTIGDWKSVDTIEMCKKGFHCSKYIQDALYWVNGCVLAVVKIEGDKEEEDKKICAQKMRITKTYKWTPEMSLKLAIFAAEQVLPIFEKYDPNDKRPRKAIEAAKKVLDKDIRNTSTHAARAAAYADADAAADAARAAAYADADAAAARAAAADAAADAAARAAADAARAAAYAADAAYAAAYAADAARAAAYADAYAADAARAAAYAADAARAAADDIKEEIHQFSFSLACKE
jgi:hypothetical protein